jgi:hypothetical protein
MFSERLTVIAGKMNVKMIMYFFVFGKKSVIILDGDILSDTLMQGFRETP